MQQVKVMIGNPRMSSRESKELIRRICEKEIRPTGMRRNVDMIPNFSINDSGW